MPNMSNYTGSVSGAFPRLLGMVPGISHGPSGGVILPGVGASLGEVCREYLSGRFQPDPHRSGPKLAIDPFPSIPRLTLKEPSSRGGVLDTKCPTSDVGRDP
ncbi:hypothetical protein YC2023_005062 [Brassica napus]